MCPLSWPQMVGFWRFGKGQFSGKNAIHNTRRSHDCAACLMSMSEECGEGMDEGHA